SRPHTSPGSFRAPNTVAVQVSDCGEHVNAPTQPVSYATVAPATRQASPSVANGAHFWSRHTRSAPHSFCSAHAAPALLPATQRKPRWIDRYLHDSPSAHPEPSFAHGSPSLPPGLQVPFSRDSATHDVPSRHTAGIRGESQTSHGSPASTTRAHVP